MKNYPQLVIMLLASALTCFAMDKPESNNDLDNYLKSLHEITQTVYLSTQRYKLFLETTLEAQLFNDKKLELQQQRDDLYTTYLSPAKLNPEYAGHPRTHELIATTSYAISTATALEEKNTRMFYIYATGWLLSCDLISLREILMQAVKGAQKQFDAESMKHYVSLLKTISENLDAAYHYYLDGDKFPETYQKRQTNLQTQKNTLHENYLTQEKSTLQHYCQHPATIEFMDRVKKTTTIIEDFEAKQQDKTKTIASPLGMLSPLTKSMYEMLATATERSKEK